jgi:hypothetical protein
MVMGVGHYQRHQWVEGMINKVAKISIEHQEFINHYIHTINHRFGENKVIYNAKYKNDIKNSFRMPPLTSEHRITPSAYCSSNMNANKNELKRRLAKTPMNQEKFKSAGRYRDISLGINANVPQVSNMICKWLIYFIFRRHIYLYYAYE